jgi:hypothetical protein
MDSRVKRRVQLGHCGFDAQTNDMKHRKKEAKNDWRDKTESKGEWNYPICSFGPTHGASKKASIQNEIYC